jgi:hypothetical protein
MKRALTGLASVGILAVTVGVETANAQSYRRYGPARTYTSQAYTPKDPARFAARAVCALLRFPTRTVRKPPAVVALATIEPFRTGEKKRRRGAHRQPRRQDDQSAAHCSQQGNDPTDGERPHG